MIKKFVSLNILGLFSNRTGTSLTTGNCAERTKLDFRCLICRSAIGQASCLICARYRQLTSPKKDIESRLFFALDGVLEKWGMCPWKSLNFLLKKGTNLVAHQIHRGYLLLWFINLCWYPPFSQRMPTNWWLPRQIIWSTQVILSTHGGYRRSRLLFWQHFHRWEESATLNVFPLLFCFREAKVYFAGAYLPGEKLNW